MEPDVKIALSYVEQRLVDVEPLPGKTKLQTLALRYIKLALQKPEEFRRLLVEAGICSAKCKHVKVLSAKGVIKLMQQLNVPGETAMLLIAYAEAGLIIFVIIDDYFTVVPVLKLYDEKLYQEAGLAATQVLLEKIGQNETVARYAQAVPSEIKQMFEELEDALFGKSATKAAYLISFEKLEDGLPKFVSTHAPKELIDWLHSVMPRRNSTFETLFANPTELKFSDKLLLDYLTPPIGYIYVNKAKKVYLICIHSNNIGLLQHLNATLFENKGVLITSPISFLRLSWDCTLIVRSQSLVKNIVRTYMHMLAKAAKDARPNYIL